MPADGVESCNLVDDDISHLMPTPYNENPEKFLYDTVKRKFEDGLSKEEISYDLTSFFVDKFSNEEIHDAIKNVFESNTQEQKEFHLTDAGNSERFVVLHGNNIRYCPGKKMKGSWYKYNGKIWQEVGEDSLLGYATDTAKRIYAEAATSPDRSRKIGEWALTSESLRSRIQMVRGACFHVEIEADDFDSRPELFNLKNGTYDLEEHSFKAFERLDYLTKISPISYVEGAECPHWENHLLTVFSGDTETVEYFQEICGYSLLQYNPQQVLFILWGEGKNGKSETIKVLKKIHADYGVNIQSESLMSSRKETGERARPDLVRLKGARLITVTEPDRKAILSEGLIKTFTGDEAITARPCYRDPVEFKPGGKIFLATNHMPKFSAGGNSIYRRVKKIPFIVEIPEEMRKADYGDFLFDNEGPGIFNWMLDGLKRYQERGNKLIESTSVKKATLDFRLESSPIGDFLLEECVITFNQNDIIGRNDLYSKYESYCEEWREEHKVNKKMFAKFLQDTGITKGKIIHGYRSWAGLRLKTVEEKEKEEETGERQTNL